MVKQDELPTSLCNQCFELLTKFSEFKKTCLNSQKVLHDVVSKSFKSEAINENGLEMKTEVEIDTSVEQVQDLKIEELADIDALEADSHDDVDSYNDAKVAVRSVKRRKKPKTVVAKTLSQLGQFKKRFTFTCELCKKKFGFKERFDAHLLEHEGKTTQIHCNPCNKTFTTWGGLKRHNDCEHTRLSVDQLTCKLCFKIFKCLRTLKIHRSTHEVRDLPICDICGKEFKSDLTLKAHLETHSVKRERVYPCQHCDKKYLSKKTCASHCSRRHSDKRYVCNHCEYSFTDKSNLAKHILIHEGKQRLHKCDICMKCYSSQWALIIHKRVHTGEKPFVCCFCPKSFSNRRMLVDHQRIHTGEKPHKCTVCEQSFTQRGTMKRHMKVHNDFVCNGKVYPAPTKI